jgi:hypothetical protein
MAASTVYRGVLNRHRLPVSLFPLTVPSFIVKLVVNAAKTLLSDKRRT